MLLEYLGVCGVLFGQYLRTKPDTLLSSFLFTAVGSALLLIQTGLVTHQYGFSLLNGLSIFFAITGYLNWRNVHVGKRRKRKG
jgi:hypothetical protein